MSNSSKEESSNHDDDDKTCTIDNSTLDTIDQSSNTNSVKVPYRLRYSQIKRNVSYQKKHKFFLQLLKKNYSIGSTSC